MRLVMVLFLSACTTDGISSTDLAGSIPDSLCTSAACAASPCTAGCVFSAMSAAGCPSSAPVRIDTEHARACPGWCGLQSIYVAGCLRYRSEDPACPTWCVSWGDASCWETTPSADYENGGAICPAGSGCFGGGPPGDLYIPCVDGGRD